MMKTSHENVCYWHVSRWRCWFRLALHLRFYPSNSTRLFWEMNAFNQNKLYQLGTETRTAESYSPGDPLGNKTPWYQHSQGMPIFVTFDNDEAVLRASRPLSICTGGSALLNFSPSSHPPSSGGRYHMNTTSNTQENTNKYSNYAS